jgi:hypothetical protein
MARVRASVPVCLAAAPALRSLYSVHAAATGAAGLIVLGAWCLAVVQRGRSPIPPASLTWTLTATGYTVVAALWWLAVMAAFSKAGRLARPVAAWYASATFTPWLLLGALAALLYASDTAYHLFRTLPQAAGLTLVPASLPLLAQSALLGWCAARARAAWASRLRGAAPAVLGGALFLLYVATSGGHLYSPDERTVYATTVALVEHRSLAIRDREPYPLKELGLGTTRRISEDGTYYGYSKYGLTTALLAAPLYLAAKLAGVHPMPWSPRFPFPDHSLPPVTLVINQGATALSAALLFALARRAGYSPAAAAFAAGAYALGTIAWPFARTLFTLPLAGALLVLAAWALLRAAEPGSTRVWYGLAGTAFGLAIATRYELALIATPAMFILWPWPSWWRCSSPAGWHGRSAALAAFTIPLAAIMACLVLWPNVLRTGSPWQVGYGGQQTFEAFSAKPYLGIFGLLFSPGFGLLVYAPPALAGLAALPALWHDCRRLGAAALWLSAASVLFYGAFDVWYGGFTWGPRYLLTTLPWMCLPLAGLWDHARRNALGRIWLGGIALGGVAVNVLAVLFDWNRGWLDHWTLNATLTQIMWQPSWSGVAAHLHVLRDWFFQGQGGIDWYLDAVAGAPAVLALLCPAAALAGMLAGAYMTREDGK